MSTLNLARNAYSSSAMPTRTPRGTEYETFLQVTQQLKASSAKKNYPAFIQALHDNRQLWTLLAVDVADPNNGLPQPLRAQIFYLAEFTQHHTSLVVDGSASIDVLVDINTSVMLGLRTQVEPK